MLYQTNQLDGKKTITASLQSGKTPTINKCESYDNKPFDHVTLGLELWECGEHIYRYHSQDHTDQVF